MLIKVINPATEEVTGSFYAADARQARRTWKLPSLDLKIGRSNWSVQFIPGGEREMDQEISPGKAEREKILDILMEETGKPLDDAIYDFEMLVNCFKYFIEEAKR